MEPLKTEPWRYRWTKTALERFEDKYRVDDSGCWIWTATRYTSGYGSFYFEGRHVGAHRWSYEHHVAPIPDGLVVDHLCHTPACVNPEHLEPVTQGENILRGRGSLIADQVARTHCPKRHPYDEKNTMRGTKGERKCRECNRQRNREWKARRRAGGAT